MVRRAALAALREAKKGARPPRVIRPDADRTPPPLSGAQALAVQALLSEKDARIRDLPAEVRFLRQALSREQGSHARTQGRQGLPPPAPGDTSPATSSGRAAAPADLPAWRRLLRRWTRPASRGAG